MPTNPDNYLGEPIAINAANGYLFTNAVIKDRIKFVVNDHEINDHAAQINRGSGALGIPADPERAAKMINLFNDDSNAYVFSKDDFLRFFEGDPDPNEPNNNLQFTHCLILIGSLPRDDNGKKKGEQTIVIAGCTKEDDNTFITSAIGNTLKNIATEHPPRSYQAKITDSVTPTFKIVQAS